MKEVLQRATEGRGVLGAVDGVHFRRSGNDRRAGRVCLFGLRVFQSFERHLRRRCLSSLQH